MLFRSHTCAYMVAGENAVNPSHGVGELDVTLDVFKLPVLLK